MPHLLIELDDAEMAALTTRAETRGETVHDLVVHLARREARRASAPPRGDGPTPAATAASSRLARQIAVAAHIKQFGMPTGYLEKQDLARQLGVTYRTLYRDLEILGQAPETPTTVPIVLAQPERRGRPPEKQTATV